MDDYKLDTMCLQEGWQPENGEPRVLPIYQSTTYRYQSSDELAGLFDLTVNGHMYTRISNPTVDCVEKKLASLEGGVGALLTSSGQAASFVSVFNICSCGQNFVSLSAIYGGTLNQFAVTMKRMGIEARFVNHDMSDDEINSMFDENTRCVFGETLANPALCVLDIERFARIAHAHNVPLIVDNTFATPLLCRPFDFGADIVTHSTSKYLDGHATVLGGVIIDSGRFDWEAAGRYPELTEPDDSYHGVVYTRDFGKAAYITKARVQLMRDLGVTPQPTAAFLLNEGIDTLAVRMERHCSNALKVAQYLENDSRITWVSYPGLESSPDHDRAMKYLPNGCSGVVSFGVKGGRSAAVKFMDSLKLAAIVVHVADCRTCVLHPASTTHRQLTDEQLVDAGVSPDLVRFSVGIENIDDILADINQALEISQK